MTLAYNARARVRKVGSGTLHNSCARVPPPSTLEIAPFLDMVAADKPPRPGPVHARPRKQHDTEKRLGVPGGPPVLREHDVVFSAGPMEETGS
jgi:hypothetical protein